MSWNYRVLAHQYKDEITLIITDVYYDDCGVPNGYGDHRNDGGGIRGEIVSGDNQYELRDVLRRMEEATEKPVLWAGSKFPQVYELITVSLFIEQGKVENLVAKLVEEGFENLRIPENGLSMVMRVDVYVTPDKIDHLSKICRLLDINFNRAN